jgi:hypothetical protein
MQGDINAVLRQSKMWLRAKTAEEIKRQIDLGNTPNFTAVVDGSKAKDIQKADQKVVVYFVSQVLTRTLNRAKDVVQKMVLKYTTKRTGLLSEGWTWYAQSGGKKGPVKWVGDTLPSNLQIGRGQYLILAPRAEYAWFANYFSKHQHQKDLAWNATKRDIKILAGKAKRGRGKLTSHNPRSLGFVGQAARTLDRDLKRIGFRVHASVTKNSPPSPAGFVSEHGVPMLVFFARRGISAQRG